MSLNIYMGYDRVGGPRMGAILVFARTAKEARRLAWHRAAWEWESWLDVAVLRLRENDHLYAEADAQKLAADEPHVIDDPRCCADCMCWGDPIGEDGLCPSCRELAEEAAI